jgi:hypothetical protein
MPLNGSPILLVAALPLTLAALLVIAATVR